MLGNRIRRASAAGDVKDRGPLRGVLRTSLTNLLAPANFHLRGAEAPPLKKGTPLHLNFAAFLSYGWGAPPNTITATLHVTIVNSVMMSTHVFTISAPKKYTFTREVAQRPMSGVRLP